IQNRQSSLWQLYKYVVALYFSLINGNGGGGGKSGLAGEQVEARAMARADHAFPFNLAFGQRPIIMRTHVAKGDDVAIHARERDWRIVNIEGEYFALLN